MSNWIWNGKPVDSFAVDKEGNVYAGGTFTISETSEDMYAALGTESFYIDDNHPCSHCRTCGGEDKYHSGTCANCGAVL